MEQPKIPTLKDAQKPQVKIKGMGAGLTLFDRLKQFKKKDLAFILAGLGTLFMAPLAEHFMMAPENGDMTAGFRGGGPNSGGRGIWGDGSSPYENGNNGIAQGGAIGGGGDIITPLNVRDPSALVMGPGSSQQPPAGSAAPATPPPAAPETKSSDYRDALAGAATRAASAATKKAPLPIPKIAVGGSGLRGLGAASGGSSSGSGSLGNIGGLGGGTAGAGGGGLNLVRAAPNFRGAAGARGPNSPSGLDGTKRAGANAGDNFSRTGSALGGLNAAANEQIPTGGQGFGGGGQGGAGANDKPGGGAGAAGSKSVGESLAFIEAKERMMENLKLEFEKRKLKDPELLLYGIRNDTAKAIASELTKMSMKKLGDMWGGKDAAGNTEWACGAAGQPGGIFKLPLSTPDCGKDQMDLCFLPNGQYKMGSTNVACQKMGSGERKAPGGAETGGGTAPPGARAGLGDGAVTVGGLNDICTQVDTLLKPTPGAKPDAPLDAALAGFGDKATQLAVLRDSMFGKTSDCATRRPTQEGTLAGLESDLSIKQAAAFDAVPKYVEKLYKDVSSDKVGDYDPALTTASDSPTLLAKEARELLDKVDAYATTVLNLPASALVLPNPTMPSAAASAENKAKMEALKKTMVESQTTLSGYLEKAKAAQTRLDGGPKMVMGSLPILTELGQIGGKDGGLLPKVQGANLDYKPKQEAIVKATEGAKADEITPDMKGVGDGVTAAKEKIGKVPTTVPPEKIDGVDNSVYSGVPDGYKAKATAARASIEGLRTAQSQWLVSVNNKSTETKATLGPPVKK